MKQIGPPPSISRLLLYQNDSILKDFRDSPICLIATTPERLVDLAKLWNWSISSLKGTRVTSALVIQKEGLSPELWVRASYKSYRKAFRLFLKKFYNIDNMDDFDYFQVDHLHPRSRFTEQNKNYFIRLALIEKKINASYGGGFERVLYRRERERDIQDGIHMDWMAYLKIQGVRLPSKREGIDGWTIWAWQCAKDSAKDGFDEVLTYVSLTVMLNLAFQDIWQPLPPHASFLNEIEAHPSFDCCPQLRKIEDEEPQEFNISIEDFVNGTAMKPLDDIGTANRDREGAYRRGYHQAIAEVMFLLKEGRTLSLEDLSKWVEEDGMKWRKDMPLNRFIIPPKL